MTKLFTTPLLRRYGYIEDLCKEAEDILDIDLANKQAWEEFKTAIFFNFNRQLTVSISLLPEKEKEELYGQLIKLIEKGNEDETISLLNSYSVLDHSHDEFINRLKAIEKDI